MQSIKLTKKHKEKLLEMCNFLFPEYKKIVLTSHNTLRFGYKKDITKTWIGNMSIHWFEFCMVYLVSKIQDNLPESAVYRNQPEYVGNIFNWAKGNKWTMYTEFFFNYPKNINKKHPVDYLYEEFKKLNLCTTAALIVE